ncbi:MAG: HAD family hydrolase [Clostridia bacterium]|nr:HAD family hydrolase [Clostridia bacterium]
MKKLVIFDLDGTLMDTSLDLMNSMNGMLETFGFPLINVEQTKEYIGNGARNFVLRSLPEGCKDRIDEALAVYNRIYNASGSPLTALYSGMDEVIRSVKQAGALIAIVSNKPQPSTDEVYAKYLKDFEFDFVYGNRQGYAHKPQKECGEFVLQELNVTEENTIVVGDGETDVLFAKNLGAACVAVTWGYRSRTVLEQAGANSFADNTFELKEKLVKFIENRS